MGVLNKSDFYVETWNWAFGSLKKNVKSDSPELKQLFELIQCTALMSPFVEAITLDESNSHFIVSIKESQHNNESKLLQHFASIDPDCLDGSITTPEYFIDVAERSNVTLVVLLTGTDSRYNYREYCGLKAVHFTEGCGLDPLVPSADYQIAFTMSDFNDVFIDDAGAGIYKVGAVEIDDDERFISPICASADAINASKKIRGQMYLKTTIKHAIGKTKRSHKRRK